MISIETLGSTSQPRTQNMPSELLLLEWCPVIMKTFVLELKTILLFFFTNEGEAPKVKDCPNDIEVTGKNGTSITWTEPIFTDNVKVTRINSNEYTLLSTRRIPYGVINLAFKVQEMSENAIL
ncbi:hypothetical protein M0804_015434 [Polistes exclamans]|nr:hypothetical protein M0804_015436 [Polistes exclamans]KAI4473219.1 hypothetical protein M0804_015434 [Polistes exclamans]